MDNVSKRSKGQEREFKAFPTLFQLGMQTQSGKGGKVRGKTLPNFGNVRKEFQEHGAGIPRDVSLIIWERGNSPRFLSGSIKMQLEFQQEFHHNSLFPQGMEPRETEISQF